MKARIILIVVGVLLLGGFVALSVKKRSGPATEVRLEKVQRRDLVSVVTASGKVQPKKKVDVSPDITGRIVTLPVVEGQMVQHGQVVVRIDPTQYQANVERSQAALATQQATAAQAQANRDQAERAFNRARDIRAQNAQLVSQEALEQATTQREIAIANLTAAERGVDQMRALLRDAQAQLAKTTIVAPIAGRITRLAVQEGEVAVPGNYSRETGLLMTISDLSVIQVKVRVDETDVVRIHVHDSTEISIDAFPDTTFTGRVTEIKNSSVAGATTTQMGQDQAVDYEVLVTLDNPPPGVRPDLSATARIVTATRKGVLAVPIISLTVRQPQDTLRADSASRRPRGSPAGAQAQTPRAPGRDTATGRKRDIEGLFVVDTTAHRVRFRPVRVGIAGDEYFEVLGGVREGETIVAGPYQAIRDLKNDGRVRSNAGRNAPRAGAPARGS